MLGDTVRLLSDIGSFVGIQQRVQKLEEAKVTPTLPWRQTTHCYLSLSANERGVHQLDVT